MSKKKAIRNVVLWLSTWSEVFLHWGHHGRWEGHTYPWKKANLLIEFDHAKLVEIPLGYQMSHYNILTETSVILFLSGVPFIPFLLPSSFSLSFFILFYFAFNHAFSFVTQCNQWEWTLGWHFLYIITFFG